MRETASSRLELIGFFKVGQSQQQSHTVNKVFSARRVRFGSKADVIAVKANVRLVARADVGHVAGKRNYLPDVASDVL